jgi:hypothetical protein
MSFFERVKILLPILSVLVVFASCTIKIEKEVNDFLDDLYEDAP